MPKMKQDQAAGLRRIMTGPRPTIISILSASENANQPQLIANLAATISANQIDVMIMHAGLESREAIAHYGLNNSPSLDDVVYKNTPFARAVKTSSLGFYATKLAAGKAKIKRDTYADDQLNRAFTSLAELYEVVLVDATLNHLHQLPLNSLNHHEILIQLTKDAASIKQAYVLIKKICGQLGRRSFGIIVADATDAEAAAVFNNIAQVAYRFMKVELEFFGAIPQDEHISRAAKLGRAVIDAFPVTLAAQAFSRIAQRLHYLPTHHHQASLASVI